MRSRSRCRADHIGHPLVCSRGLLTRTYHGLPHGFRASIERQNRLMPVYTSDCPPSGTVAMIDELERLGGDVDDGAARDGCSCVRAGIGCRQWCVQQTLRKPDQAAATASVI